MRSIGGMHNLGATWARQSQTAAASKMRYCRNHKPVRVLWTGYYHQHENMRPVTLPLPVKDHRRARGPWVKSRAFSSARETTERRQKIWVFWGGVGRGRVLLDCLKKPLCAGSRASWQGVRCRGAFTEPAGAGSREEYIAF